MTISKVYVEDLREFFGEFEAPIPASTARWCLISVQAILLAILYKGCGFVAFVGIALLLALGKARVVEVKTAVENDRIKEIAPVGKIQQLAATTQTEIVERVVYKAPPKCNNGHELRYEERKAPGSISCDGCTRSNILPPERSYRCKTCDFDLCEECFRSRSKAPAPLQTLQQKAANALRERKLLRDRGITGPSAPAPLLEPFRYTLEEHQQLSLSQRLERARINCGLNKDDWNSRQVLKSADGSTVSPPSPRDEQFPIAVRLKALKARRFSDFRVGERVEYHGSQKISTATVKSIEADKMILDVDFGSDGTGARTILKDDQLQFDRVRKAALPPVDRGRTPSPPAHPRLRKGSIFGGLFPGRGSATEAADGRVSITELALPETSRCKTPGCGEKSWTGIKRTCCLCRMQSARLTFAYVQSESQRSSIPFYLELDDEDTSDPIPNGVALEIFDRSTEFDGEHGFLKVQWGPDLEMGWINQADACEVEMEAEYFVRIANAYGRSSVAFSLEKEVLLAGDGSLGILEAQPGSPIIEAVRHKAHPLSEYKVGEKVKYHGSGEVATATVNSYVNGEMSLTVEFSDCDPQKRSITNDHQRKFESGDAKIYGISKKDEIPNGGVLPVFDVCRDWLQVSWKGCLVWIEQKHSQAVHVLLTEENGLDGPVWTKTEKLPKEDFIPNGTLLHALRATDDFVEIVWKGQKAWIKRKSACLRWDEDASHPLFVPSSHIPSDSIETIYAMMPNLPQLKFDRDGARAASSEDDGEDDASINDEMVRAESMLVVFPELKRTGSEWEQHIYRALDDKLNEWPQTCKKHGYRDDARWEIDSVRAVCNRDTYDAFDKTSTSDGEPILAFHGTQLCWFKEILRHNFKVDCKGGWYGNGGYFTTCLPYSQHYIGGIDRKNQRGKDPDHGFMLPRVGNTVYIFASLLKPGTCEVIEPDKTPPGIGYQGRYRNMKKDPRTHIHSHLAYVKPPNLLNPFGIGFRPTTKENAAADEYVIFDQTRVVPRFIVGLKRTA